MEIKNCIKKDDKICTIKKKPLTLHRKNGKDGAIAQLVEHRTENPCVPGSNPGGTTVKIANNLIYRLLAIFYSTQIGRVPYKVTYNTTL